MSTADAERRERSGAPPVPVLSKDAPANLDMASATQGSLAQLRNRNAVLETALKTIAAGNRYGTPSQTLLEYERLARYTLALEV